MDKLILKFKDQVLKEYPITGNQIKIGREDDNDFVIDNAAVSRYHAKINRVGGEYIVEDLNSTNGTFVNENRITQQEKLWDGDIIIVGKHTIILESEYKVEAQDGTDFGETMVLDTKSNMSCLISRERQLSHLLKKNKLNLLLFIPGSERNTKLPRM